jgi:hypothetical protein
MKEALVDFSQLSESEIAILAEVLQTGEFEIVRYDPSGDNHPEGLLDIFTTKPIYAWLLNDQDADLAFFSIRFRKDRGCYIRLPVGVYGFSAVNNVSYPLIATGYLRDFLDVSKADFDNILKVDDEGASMAYGKLVGMRYRLMTRIFSFYRDVNPDRNAFTAWKIRNKESATRKAAEAALHRLEYPDAGIEFYHSKPADETTMYYLTQCLGRWESLSKDFSKLAIETPKYENEFENMKKFPATFYSELISLEGKSL